jgi:CIC family chloride channel protein
MARRWKLLFLYPILTGLAGGAAAAAMEWGLHFGTEALIGKVVPADAFATLQFHWIIFLLPAIGGLICGLIVPRLCPGPQLQGTDTVIRAFHRNNGQLPLRGPVVKAATAVEVISCGGSAGPEGPIAALGAALGSACGRLFGVSPRQMRILLLAGCASGIGAIFRCPLGGALFAAGVIYSEPDYESEAIIPSVIASVVGYSVYMWLWGHGQPMLRHARDLTFASPLELVPYAALGVACGLVTMCFTWCLRAVERLSHRLTWLPIWLKPGIGGLATGAIACFLPQVMDFRYNFIQQTMDGRLAAAGPIHWWHVAALFAMILIGKCIATSCTVGSGAAGGVLGPSLFIGGMTGALLGAVLEAQFPGTFPEPLRQALIPVGMAGVLAAGMRTPLAAAIMVIEMTESYGLIVPLMLVCATAYVVGSRLGLNQEQVPTSTQSPVHSADTIVHLLEALRVKDFLDRGWKLVVAPDAGLKEMIERIRPGEQLTFAVVHDQSLLGVIMLPDLGRVVADEQLAKVVIAHDIMQEDAAALAADDNLYRALELFRLHHCNVLPVVAGKSKRWLGMLTRERVFDILKERNAAAKAHIMREHAGLFATEKDGQLDEFLAAVTPLDNATLRRIMVPALLAGLTIREAQARGAYAHQIVAIEAANGALQSPPNLDRPLDVSDHLLVIAGAEAEEEASECGR